jgi:uncharacterized membrane protein
MVTRPVLTRTTARAHRLGGSRRPGGVVCRLLVLLLVLGLAAAPAAARNWRIADYHTTAAIGADGSAYIEEEIKLVFAGSYNGIYRRIPLDYPGPHGSNYSLFLRLREVSEAGGGKLKYEAKRKGKYEEIKIYIPGATDTSKTVRIAYTIPNAIRFFGDYDEFYWNVTGNEWPVPIDHASATVALPEAAAGGVRAQAFTGVYGSREQEATSDVQGAIATFETTNPLPMRGGLTIDVAIPKGVLTPPSALTKIAWFIRSNSILLLPLVALAVMFPLWWYKGKDPEAGMSVAPMYEPPPGMSPAEVGTLVDDSIDPRDITSTVVDLAVRGFVKIEETADKHLLWTNKDYIFHLLKGQQEWKGLRPHEQVVLENMFGGGQQVRMSDLKNRFYTAIPVIKQDVMAALKEKGMYTVDPSSAGAYVVGAAVLIGAPFVLLDMSHVVDFFVSVPMAVVGIGVAALIVILFGRQMTAKSLMGVRTRVRILGFEEFMNRVDADRLKRMPPDTFEKYLPYAMALGVEHRWAQAFKDILREPPRWYTGPSYPGTYWNPIMFTNTMHGMSNDLHSVMTSAPRSSSTGSGFGGGGGGGFSGGGFGGGGGDAF